MVGPTQSIETHGKNIVAAQDVDHIPVARDHRVGGRLKDRPSFAQFGV
jgi:hypothetical protein